MSTDAYDYQRSALLNGIVQDKRNPMNDTYTVLRGMRKQGVSFKDSVHGIAWSVLDAVFGKSGQYRPDVQPDEQLRLQFVSAEEYRNMAYSNSVSLLPNRDYAVATANPQMMFTHGRRISVLKFDRTAGVRVPARGFALLGFNLGNGQWGCRPYSYQLRTGQRVLQLALTERSLWEEYMTAGRPISLLEVTLESGQSALGVTLGDVYAATIAEPTANVVAHASESLEALYACDADEDVEPAACHSDKKAAVAKSSCNANFNSVVARQLATVVGKRLTEATGSDVVGAISAVGTALPVQVFGSEDDAVKQDSWPGLGHLSRQVAIINYHRENYGAIDKRAKEIARRRFGAAASAGVQAAECPQEKPVACKARAPIGGGAFHVEAMLELARESVGLAPASPLADALFEVYQRTYGPDLLTAVNAMPTVDQMLDQVSGLPQCFDRTPAAQLEELLSAEIDDMRAASAPRDTLDRYAANLLRDSTPLARGGALFGPSGVADLILSMCVPRLHEITAHVLTSALGMSKRATLSGFPVGAALADSHTQGDVRGLQMTVMADVYDAAMAARAINAALTERDGSVDVRRAVLATHVFNWRLAESLVDRYETSPGPDTRIPLRNEQDRMSVFLTASPTMQGMIGARPTLFPADDDERDEKKYAAHGSVDPRTLVTLKYAVSGVSNGGNTLVAVDPFSGVVVVARTQRRIPAMESLGARGGVVTDVFAAVYETLMMKDSSRRSTLALFELIKAAGQARAVSDAFLVQQPDKSQAELSNARSDERRANLRRVVEQAGSAELVMLAGGDDSSRSSLRLAAVADKPDMLDVTISQADGTQLRAQAKFDPRFGRSGGEYRVQRRVDDEEPAAPLLMQVVPSLKLANGESLQNVVLVSYWCNLYTPAAAASLLIEEQARRLKAKGTGEPAAAAAAAGVSADDEYYPVSNAKPTADPTLFAADGVWARIKAASSELAGPSHGERAILHPWLMAAVRPGADVFTDYSLWH